ncbi:MAG TPA: LytTR family DNA-binding domain-containing protein [Terriglobales bacterium]|nr:LytTR family DNA-binding domain-containing protein [Terriglobales bacterium]
MNNVKALIVEDERLAANALHRLLLNDPEIQVVGIAADGKSAVSKIQALKPDIVFLDIEIPEMNGFDVIETVGIENMPLVIFVTAYDRYTLKAFEVHALDYLLKPFDEARLSAALGRAKRELEFRRTYQRSKLTGLMETVAERRGLKRFPIKSAGRTVFIQLDEIDYLEAAGNYVRLHTGGNEYLTRDTMSSFEAKLSESDFVRIHRSVIVNRKRIKELRPWFTGEYVVILTTGKELTLSRGYRDRLPLLLAPV